MPVRYSKEFKRMIMTMFKQLKVDMDILQEYKNKKLNEIEKSKMWKCNLIKRQNFLKKYWNDKGILDNGKDNKMIIENSIIQIKISLESPTS